MANLVNGLGGSNGFGEQEIGLFGSEQLELFSVLGSGLRVGDRTYDQIFITASGILLNDSSDLTSGASFSIDPYFSDGNRSTPNPLPPSPGGTSTGSDRVFYDLDSENRILTVTWDDVRSVLPNDSQNAYQIRILAGQNGDFDIEIRYETLEHADSSFFAFDLPGFSVSSNSGTASDNVSGAIFETPEALQTFVGSDSQAGFLRYTVRDGVVAADFNENDLPPAVFADAIFQSDLAPLIVDVAAQSQPNADGFDLGSLRVLQGPSTGSVEVLANGTLRLTAGSKEEIAALPFGFDQIAIEFTADDGQTSVGSVFLQYPRITFDDTATAVSGEATSIAVLANDQDQGFGENVAVVDGPEHGTINIRQNGVIAYTSEEGFSGTDSFSYLLPDQFGEGDSTTAEVTVTVLPELPNAGLVNGLGGVAGFGEAEITFSTRLDLANVFGTPLLFEDTVIEELFIPSDPSLLAFLDATNQRVLSATPLDQEPERFSSGTGLNSPGGTSTGSNSVFLDSTDEVITITWDDVSAGGFAFPDSDDISNAYQVQIVNRSDTAGRSSGDFDIVFRYEWMTWVTEDGAYGLPDSPEDVIGRAGIFDLDGAAIFELPGSGNLDGLLDLPFTIGNTGQTGVYVFEVRNAENAPPVAVDDSTLVSQFGSVSVDVLANDFDPESLLDLASLRIVTGPESGSAFVSGTEIVYGTANQTPVGIQTITYEISDQFGATATADLDIEVLAPPTIVDDFASVRFGESVTVDVLSNDVPGSRPFDPDSLTITSQFGGTAVVEGSSITFTDNPDQLGGGFVIYSVADTAGQVGFGSLSIGEERPDLTLSVSGRVFDEGDTANQQRLTLDLNDPTPSRIELPFRTVAGTAESWIDFEAVSGVIVFDAGEQTATVDIPILGDIDIEFNETLSLEIDLTNEFQGGARTTSIPLTILNDDAPLTLSVSGRAFDEGDEANLQSLTLELSDPAPSRIELPFRTVAGTAESGIDFEAVTGVIVFEAGEQTATVDIPILGDIDIEFSETLSLEIDLSNDFEGGTRTTSIPLTILNDDAPLTLSVSGRAFDEGDELNLQRLTLDLSDPAPSRFELPFRTVAGTAESGSDFEAVTGVIVFEAGEQTASIEIPILGDTDIESSETLSLEIDLTTDFVGGAQTTSIPLTILNDDVSVLADFALSFDLPTTNAVGEVAPATVSVTYNGEETSVGHQLIVLSMERGLLEDPFTGVFSQNVFVIAQGGEDGVFSSGETEVIEVNFKGTAGPRQTINGTAEMANPDAISDIADRIIAFQPDFISDSANNQLSENISDLLGEDFGSLTFALAGFGQRLGSFGLDSKSATAALAYATEAAGDFGGIEERGKVGSLGQGWSSLADLGLDIDGTSIRLRGLTDTDALQALSVDASALYTISYSANRSVTLSGDLLAFTAPRRPSFDQQVDGQFDTNGPFDGTLRKTSNGYEIVTGDLETLVFDADGNFLRFELPDGLSVVASYDTEMRITGLTGPNNAALAFARDAEGYVSDVTDADGETAVFTYDANGRLVGVERADGTSDFTYTVDGDLTGLTAPGDLVTAVTYDSTGRVQTIASDGGTQSESFAYDSFGGVTNIDGEGREVTYDLLPGGVLGRITNQLDETSELIFDDDGAVTGLRAADGTETGLLFDDAGRLTQITDARGATLSFEYADNSSNPSTFTDGGGNSRGFDYDDGARITEATWPDGTALQFTYDAQGNLTGYTNRRGDDVDYTYDARGRLLSESDSSAGATSYVYDTQGRLTSATNDQGTTSLTYDDADRVTQIDYPTGKSLLYTYNEAGLRASMSDGGDYNLFYDYDGVGRLTGLRDEDGSVVTYAYDQAGNLIREENGNGTVTTFTYDVAGRVTRIENAAPDGSLNSFNAYTYDTAGQRITNETQDGAWAYGYDPIGQLTSAVFTSTNSEIANKSLSYEYDDAGNRTRVVEDGVETLYTANALNQYTQVGEETFTYDADGNMTSRTGAAGTTTYTYDLDNRLTSVTEADGTVLEFAYDLFGNRVAKAIDGVETEYLVDPFGLSDVVSEFTDGALIATYAHGLGLAAGEIGGEDAFYDADVVGTVTTLTDMAGQAQNSYLFTPFGTELFEVETVANDFEFNGVFGVTEDGSDLTFMRARSYDESLGRFTSEEPLIIYGDTQNLYRFAANTPLQFVDPTGLYIQDPESFNDPTKATGPERPPVSNLPDARLGRGDLTGNDARQFNEDLNDFARGAGEIGFSILIGSKVKAARGAKEGIEAALDTFLNINEAKEKSEEVRRILEDSTGKGEPDGPNVEPDPDAPADPPVDPDNPDTPPPPDDGSGPQDGDDSRTDPADGDTRNYGDPHLITFDRTGYSFQAVGEFTMVVGDGFEMQVRMEPISDVASVNTAVSMRVGDDIIAVYADETIPLVANGTAVLLARGESVAIGDLTIYRWPNGTDEDLANSRYLVSDSAGNGFFAFLRDGFINLSPFISDDAPVAGLLGNLDGDRSNDFALRDGTVLERPIPETVLYGEFADSWRISGESSFFLYRDGESTETFTDLDFPPNIVTFASLDPDARAAAELVAQAAGLVPGTFIYETTVIDIVLTGNNEFAEAIADAPELGTEDFPDDVPVVEINEGPELPDVQVGANEDGSITISVLDGVTDPEGDTLFLISASDPAGGQAVIEGGRIVYTPPQDFNGETVLSYRLGDSAGNVVEGSITVNIDPEPDAPEPEDDGGAGFAVDANSVFTTANVLENDADADGDELSIAGLDTTGTLGLVTDNGDGTFDYDPNGAFESLGADQSGTDSFRYVVEDGNGNAVTATVTITISGVNDDPVATDDSDATAENAAVDIDVLANDTDVEGDTLSVASVGAASNGTTEINANGTIRYTPNAGFDDVDSFSYTVSDGNGGTDSGTVTVNVSAGPNRPPVVSAITAGFGEDQTGRMINLLDPAFVSDPDGDDLDVENVVVATADGRVLSAMTDFETGLFTLDDGQFEDLAAGVPLDVTVNYVVTDGIVSTANTATLTVTGANDNPDASADGGLAFATDEGSAFTTGSVLVNDTDGDGDALTVAGLDTAGTLGLVTNNGDGTFGYDTNGAFENLVAGESATDSFSYTVSDGNGGTDTADVTITVNGVDDDPTDPDPEVLLGQWLFAADAPTANSAPGSDNPAAFRNGAVAVDGSISLDGQNDYVLINNVPEYEIASGGVRIAFSVDQLSGQSSGTNFSSNNLQTLFSRDSSGFDGGGHITAFVDGDGSILLRHQSQIESYDIRTEADLFEADDDVDLVYRFDETDGMELFVGVNGGDLTLVGSNADPILDGDPVGLIGNTEPWTLGASQVRSSDETADRLRSYFDGEIDSFQVFAGEDLPTGSNEAPVAVDDGGLGFATDEDSAFTTGSVLVNDTDGDGNALTVAGLDTAGTLGLVTNNGDGTFGYDTNGAFENLVAGESATDSFSYTVSDGNGGTDTADVTITVNGVDDDPTDPDPEVLLGQWLFAADAPTANSAPGSDNPAAFRNGAVAVDGSISLDGQNDYVLINNVPEYEIASGGVRIAFSVDQLSGQSSGTNFSSNNLQTLFSRDSSGFDGGGHITAFVDGDGSILLRHQSQIESYDIRTEADLFEADDDVDLVYRFDETDGMELFVGVNGGDLTLVGSNANTVLDGDPVSLIGNSEPWTLGVSQVRSNDEAADRLRSYFDGEIDSFQIFTGEDAFVF